MMRNRKALFLLTALFLSAAPLFGGGSAGEPVGDASEISVTQNGVELKFETSQAGSEQVHRAKVTSSGEIQIRVFEEADGTLGDALASIMTLGAYQPPQDFDQTYNENVEEGSEVYYGTEEGVRAALNQKGIMATVVIIPVVAGIVYAVTREADRGSGHTAHTHM